MSGAERASLPFRPLTSSSMQDDSVPSSPTHALVSLALTDPDWQEIFHASNQVVLYNPTSHALSIRPSSQTPDQPRSVPCPYCNRPLPPDFEPETDDHGIAFDPSSEFYSRASNYFQLLAIANETLSRPSTPPPITNDSRNGRSSTFSAEAMAEGYFKAFFQEECRLGMGANGTVFLCQHMLDGNPLGHFAVKKIAVGESHSYLLNILREVRLLERLHHPNIITYHHAWLETCQFSSFGPKVPTLHVLMQWAEGGSLDDFIEARLGRNTQRPTVHPLTSAMYPIAHLSSTSDSSFTPMASPSLASPSANSNPTYSASSHDQLSRSARIRAFRALQRATPEERERMRREMPGDSIPATTGMSARTTWTAVHLLSAEEVKNLFGDVVEGLSFLHDRSILHLDLKPGNVLLTWDEGKLIPRAMLSDFGTSRDMLHSARTRSGNTGTLEYSSPESLPSPRTGFLHQVDSKSDLWSLGMILHKLLFFRLPYRYASDEDNTESGTNEGEKMNKLETEILDYPGFKSTQALVTAFESRRLPRAFLVLLESLLNVTPSGRPPCERVTSAIREGKLDPLQISPGNSKSSLISVVRRHSNPNQGPEVVETQSSSEPQVTHPSNSNEKKPLREASTKPEGENLPLLGLPASKKESAWKQSARSITTVPTTIPRVVWIRSTKSSLLVAKVWSIALLCPDSPIRLPIMGLIMFSAIVDTWFDSLWTSIVLGLLHILVVRVGCDRQQCCS